MNIYQRNCLIRYGEVLIAAFLFTVVCVVAAGASAQTTSVWRVSDGMHEIYLGGVIHDMRMAEYPLPDAFEFAYRESDEVYIEIDMIRSLTASIIEDMGINTDTFTESIYLSFHADGKVGCVVS